jgi:hypothetical protein
MTRAASARTGSPRRSQALLVASALGLVACGGSSSPLLWEARTSQGQTSCLLGTIHLGVSAREDLPSVVWTRFDAAARFVAEAEVRAIDQQEYLKLAALTGGKTLDQLLPAAIWPQVMSLLGDASLETLRGLRPWAVMMMIYQHLVPTQEGMDLTLLGAADLAGKQLVFLEAWQDQVAALNQTSLEQDVRDLTTLVENRATVDRKLDELIALYKSGDAEGVERLAPEAGAVPAVTDPVFDTFIRARNQRWLPLLEQQLQAGSAFVAVGFGHLLGPEGLIQTLQQRGYTVRRVE